MPGLGVGVGDGDVAVARSAGIGSCVNMLGGSAPAAPHLNLLPTARQVFICVVRTCPGPTRKRLLRRAIAEHRTPGTAADTDLPGHGSYRHNRVYTRRRSWSESRIALHPSSSARPSPRHEPAPEILGYHSCRHPSRRHPQSSPPSELPLTSGLRSQRGPRLRRSVASMVLAPVDRWRRIRRLRPRAAASVQPTSAATGCGPEASAAVRALAPAGGARQRQLQAARHNGSPSSSGAMTCPGPTWRRIAKPAKHHHFAASPPLPWTPQR